MEADTGVMQPPAEGRLKPPGAGKAVKHLSLNLQGELGLAMRQEIGRREETPEVRQD